jgi:alkyl hydroperoxide reductase subunit AhpF
MALLSPADQQTLREAFAGMTQPVTILFFTQAIGCETCDETRRILAEITEVTNQVTVEEVNLVLEGDQAAQYAVDRAPALVLLAGEERGDTRIRMLGAPSGYDFMSLVDAILVVGSGSHQALSADSLEKIAAVTDPLTIRVFVTPT